MNIIDGIRITVTPSPMEGSGRLDMRMDVKLGDRQAQSRVFSVHRNDFTPYFDAVVDEMKREIRKLLGV